jgi:serine/threonine-protein kinase
MTVGTSTSDGRRFRVLRPHARGGLGVVFVALDEELHREVALKQILDDHADDPASRQRFLVEAEITGGLEHPGIVPVYGLGSHGDGRPYYAMRFIKGDSLKEAIEHFHAAADLTRDPGRRSLELRKLLRRFLDVCNAIEYAHSRGVLHRDIKPGNIVVGKHGETLVVDWGLAKAMGSREPSSASDERTLMPSSASGSAETLPGSALGTPAYMSPEQARGDIDALGPRSDVYSLGATLYFLLTGKAPFAGEVDVVLYKVEAGKFSPPRVVAPTIDPALEAVCLKAMAKKPADRYATAHTMSDDVERWLADESVTAYPEPFLRRARRWGKRNRTLVLSLAVALLMAAVSLGVVSTVQSTARHNLALKNAALTQARNALAARNAELARANTALDTQRQRAEDREKQAIAAVKRFGDAVSKNAELKNNPKLESLRKALLKEPLSFFRTLHERLLAANDTRPDSLRALASACEDLASLTDEIGDRQDALALYQEALAVFQQLTRANPTVAVYQMGLAGCYTSMGIVLRDVGRFGDALAADKAAMAVSQKLADANPSNAEFQNSLAIAYNNLGIELHWMRRYDEALKAYQAAGAIREKLAAAKPADDELRYYVGLNHRNTGLVLRDSGRPVEAMKELEAGRVVLQVLAEAHPSVSRYRRYLADCHCLIGGLLLKSERWPDAYKAYAAALAVMRKLAEENPTVTAFQDELALYYGSFGDLPRGTVPAAEALKAYESALAIRRTLVHDHPESSLYAFRLGWLLSSMARDDWHDKRFDEARTKYREAISWEKSALATEPRNPTYRAKLVGDVSNLILVTRALGRSDEAAAAQRELDDPKITDPTLVALDTRLAAVRKGTAPKDNAERLTLAQRAYDTMLYEAATSLWAAALEADPKLAADRQARHRYNAACAAALAVAGEGKDAPPDVTAKAHHRAQALSWLRGELDAWKKVVETSTPEQRTAVVPILRHWQEDTDLASVRDPAALAKLPNDQRSAWQALWADVDRLIAPASGAKSQPASLDLPDDVFAR